MSERLFGDGRRPWHRDDQSLGQSWEPTPTVLAVALALFVKEHRSHPKTIVWHRAMRARYS